MPSSSGAYHRRIQIIDAAAATTTMMATGIPIACASVLLLSPAFVITIAKDVVSLLPARTGRCALGNLPHLQKNQ